MSASARSGFGSHASSSSVENRTTELLSSTRPTNASRTRWRGEHRTAERTHRIEIGMLVGQGNLVRSVSAFPPSPVRRPAPPCLCACTGGGHRWTPHDRSSDEKRPADAVLPRRVLTVGGCPTTFPLTSEGGPVGIRAGLALTQSYSHDGRERCGNDIGRRVHCGFDCRARGGLVGGR